MCYVSPVTCHMLPVTCHLSCVTCHLSNVKIYIHFLYLFNKVVELVGGGSVINGAYPYPYPAPSSFLIEEHILLTLFTNTISWKTFLLCIVVELAGGGCAKSELGYSSS